MNEDQYRALVVDDEPLVRQLTMRALSRRGFRCEPASDGAQGAAMAASTAYDVVVTDLQMPNQHGHSLAVELLAHERRPAVVIVTGLAEPKLAKDLLARGVDDVLFKPVDYDFLAAKIEAIIQRRRDHLRLVEQSGSPHRVFDGQTFEGAKPATHGNGGPRAERSDIEAKLAHLSKILPVSQAAFDVFNMTSTEKYETVEIAAAIARDASLSADILRLANSGFYNPSGAKITALEEAVVRIGQKRIGDLALANTTMAALTTSVLPWLNTDLAWRRSIAAGVAADLLLERTKSKEVEEGLFLSAIMHPLGRIALAMLYPHEYQRMVKECGDRGETLADHERRDFSISHGEIVTLLFRRWDIPSSVCEPLPYVTHRYAALNALREPLRTKAELLKLAILIGRLAIQKWEPWDAVDFPPEPMLKRLGIESLPELVKETKADSAAIVQFAPQPSRVKGNAAKVNESTEPSHELSYCNVSAGPFDFLAALLSSTGINLTPCDPDALDLASGVLVNSIATPATRLASLVNPRVNDGKRVILTDAENTDRFVPYGRVLQTPMAFGLLRSACAKIARVNQTTTRHTESAGATTSTVSLDFPSD